MALKFRRGTTAQQSGSLAFGEPYVNTDLGTLVVGGTNGDIVLSSTGTGSNLVVNDITASGNVSVAGNVTVGGKLTIGDATSDTVTVVASLSSSLIPQTANTYDLGTAEKFWRDLYISTGSIKFVDNSGTVVGTLTGNASGDLKITGELSGSSIAGLGNASQFSASVASRVVRLESDMFNVTASVQAINIWTSSVSTTTSVNNLSASIYQTDSTQSNNITTAQNSANGAFASASAYSASAAVVAQTNANSAAGAFASASAYSASAATALNALSSSVASTDSTQTNNIATNAAAAAGAFASASAYSASAATALSSVSGAVATSLNNASSSAFSTFAKLNESNTFTGTQTITGSLYVSQNLIVQGSSSLQNITASAVSIGTNTVILNTDSPAVRFGGIKVIDSGSSAATGSLLWDSEQNVWLYTNPDGIGYVSARLISGPQNTGSIGNEPGLTVGQVPVAVGDDHIGNSIISASATKVTIAGGLDVTGNISASTLSGVGNVAAFSTSVDSRIITNLNSAAGAFASASAYSSSAATSFSASLASQTALSASIASTDATQTTNITANSASAAGAFASASAYSASAATSFSASLATITANSQSAATSFSASIASQTALSASIFTTTLTNANSAAGAFASASAYSASAAVIDNAQTANITTAQNSANGAFASASAYSASAVTTYAKLATANTFTANQIVSGSITATGDVIAFSTSDKRHKNNIVLISDALTKVTKLNGVTWEWNEDVDDATKQSPKTGLIAQEVQEVLPEVVKEKGDGFLALDYSKMVGLLVEAIKEQQTQIHSLTLEIEKLKKNNSL